MRISRQSWLAITVLSFAVAVVMLPVGCNRSAAPNQGGDVKEAAKKAPVEPLPASLQMTFTHKIDGPGEIMADEQTRIFAKITGYVKKVCKDAGDEVKPGTVLAELSVPEYDEELKQKQALVTQAEAELARADKLHKAAEANVRYAKARLKEAIAARPKAAAELARAESTYERLKKNSSVIADEAIAETKLGFEAAKAMGAEVEAKIESARAAEVESAAKRDTAFAEIAVARARLDVAEAARRNWSEIVNYATLTAPYAGVVVQRNVNLGDLVHSSAGGIKGEPIFVVARMTPVRIFVDVPENDAVLVVDGKTEASVRVQALKGEVFPGTVARSSWSLDPKGRILRAQIDLPNSDGKLRPGMYAYATITVMHKDVWAVPLSAVVTKDDQTFLFLEENGKALRTVIRTGLRDGKFIEVVKKRGPDGGWQPFTRDDKVITANVAALVDGQAIGAGAKK